MPSIPPRIPLCDPARHVGDLVPELQERLESVLLSGRWLKGPETEAFEAEFGTFVGVDHCLGVANATDALELALRVAGEHRPTGEVIMTANAGPYASTASRLVGLTPVFVDVADDLTINPDRVEEALSAETLAVIVTHLFGNVADAGGVRRRLNHLGRTDVTLVEDCSQAHGASFSDGTSVGSVGDLAVFSFYPTKNLSAMGDGGAVLTSDDSVFTALVELHQYGWSQRYTATRPHGRNSRLDEVQAAILRVKLPHLREWNHERRRIAGLYSQAAERAGLAFATDWMAGGVAHLAVIRSDSRRQLRRHLAEAGIDSDIHYPILDSDQVVNHDLDRVHLPASEQAVSEVLSVPCFPGMTDEEVGRVATALGTYEGEAR